MHVNDLTLPRVYMPTLGLMCVRAPHTAKDIHEVQLEGSQNLYEEWPHTTGTRVTVHEWF